MENIVKKLFLFQSVQLNAQTAYKLRFIMIKLQNEGIYKQIDELFPLSDSENISDDLLNYVKDLIQYKCYPNPYDNFDSLIPSIAKKFILINSDLKQLPKSILLQIISNENLKLQSEDSLYDFIEEIFNNNLFDDDENISKYQFYEHLKFQYLSKAKFDEFVNNLDYDEMTRQLWKKLKSFLKSNFQSKIYSIDEFIQRYNYVIEHFEYDNDTNHLFKGIISHLTEKCGGQNVYSSKIVNLTYSSIHHMQKTRIFLILKKKILISNLIIG